MALRLTSAGALLLLGVFAGGVVFTVLAPALQRLPGPAYVRYWQALNTDYGRVMPVLLLSTLALLVATAVLAHGAARVLAVIAGVLVLGIVVLTVTTMEPLNRLADGWDADALPGDWAAARDRWNGLHQLRTLLAVLAFGCLVAGAVLPSAARAETVASVPVPVGS